VKEVILMLQASLSAKSVNSAFEKFSKNVVDLDPEEVVIARKSRKWLVQQIESFPETIDNFPSIYLAENDVQMGSFSRRTKTRPLDDIDFLVVFSAQGSTYYEPIFGGIHINVPENAKTLRELCDGDQLNSRKLLNKLKSSLSDVHQYEKADIHRNQEAVTLKLKSYTWNFDIVPAFITAPDSEGRNYYLIPDGNGKWKKTDPRIDSKRTTEINQRHDGKLLKIIRMIKYWNKNGSMPSISSYLLENISLNYFEGLTEIKSTQEALRDFFIYLKNAIYFPCMDPKGIQGDLNQLDYSTKWKVSNAAKQAAEHAQNAISYEIDNDHESAIDEWKKVFGSKFPSYG
jgi:Second Messenger Oligonucleotide or Dinucleotide Synthetase domain